MEVSLPEAGPTLVGATHVIGLCPEFKLVRLAEKKSASGMYIRNASVAPRLMRRPGNHPSTPS